MQRLSDRAEIGDRLCAYCEALDAMDLERLHGVFATDCVVEFGSDERLNARGCAAVVAALARLWRWKRTSHHLSNVRIRFTGEASAEARSYVIAWHERPDGSTATLYGIYVDQMVRSDQGWRIVRRRQEMNGSDGRFPLSIFPAARNPAPAGWTPPDIEAPAS
jgi:3-phenylpropionate/cinnamic acid dioxygenase small subunit